MPLTHCKGPINIEPQYDGVVMLSPDVVFFNDAQPRSDGGKIYHIFEHAFDDDYDGKESMDEATEDYDIRKNSLLSKATEYNFSSMQQTLAKNGIFLEKWLQTHPTSLQQTEEPLKPLPNFVSVSNDERDFAANPHNLNAVHFPFTHHQNKIDITNTTPSIHTLASTSLVSPKILQSNFKEIPLSREIIDEKFPQVSRSLGPKILIKKKKSLQLGLQPELNTNYQPTYNNCPEKATLGSVSHHFEFNKSNEYMKKSNCSSLITHNQPKILDSQEIFKSLIKRRKTEEGKKCELKRRQIDYVSCNNIQDSSTKFIQNDEQGSSVAQPSIRSYKTYQASHEEKPLQNISSENNLNMHPSKEVVSSIKNKWVNKPSENHQVWSSLSIMKKVTKSSLMHRKSDVFPGLGNVIPDIKYLSSQSELDNSFENKKEIKPEGVLPEIKKEIVLSKWLQSIKKRESVSSSQKLISFKKNGAKKPILIHSKQKNSSLSSRNIGKNHESENAFPKTKSKSRLSLKSSHLKQIHGSNSNETKMISPKINNSDMKLGPKELTKNVRVTPLSFLNSKEKSSSNLKETLKYTRDVEFDKSYESTIEDKFQVSHTISKSHENNMDLINKLEDNITLKINNHAPKDSINLFVPFDIHEKLKELEVLEITPKNVEQFNNSASKNTRIPLNKSNCFISNNPVLSTDANQDNFNEIYRSNCEIKISNTIKENKTIYNSSSNCCNQNIETNLCEPIKIIIPKSDCNVKGNSNHESNGNFQRIIQIFSSNINKCKSHLKEGSIYNQTFSENSIKKYSSLKSAEPLTQSTFNCLFENDVSFQNEEHRRPIYLRDVQEKRSKEDFQGENSIVKSEKTRNLKNLVSLSNAEQIKGISWNNIDQEKHISNENIENSIVFIQPENIKGNETGIFSEKAEGYKTYIPLENGEKTLYNIQNPGNVSNIEESFKENKKDYFAESAEIKEACFPSENNREHIVTEYLQHKDHIAFKSIEEHINIKNGDGYLPDSNILFEKVKCYKEYVPLESLVPFQHKNIHLESIEEPKNNLHSVNIVDEYPILSKSIKGQTHRNHTHSERDEENECYKSSENSYHPFKFSVKFEKPIERQQSKNYFPCSNSIELEGHIASGNTEEPCKGQQFLNYTPCKTSIELEDHITSQNTLDQQSQNASNNVEVFEDYNLSENTEEHVNYVNHLGSVNTLEHIEEHQNKIDSKNIEGQEKRNPSESMEEHMNYINSENIEEQENNNGSENTGKNDKCKVFGNTEDEQGNSNLSENIGELEDHITFENVERQENHNPSEYIDKFLDHITSENNKLQANKNSSGDIEECKNHISSENIKIDEGIYSSENFEEYKPESYILSDIKEHYSPVPVLKNGRQHDSHSDIDEHESKNYISFENILHENHPLSKNVEDHKNHYLSKDFEKYKTKSYISSKNIEGNFQHISSENMVEHDQQIAKGLIHFVPHQSPSLSENIETHCNYFISKQINQENKDYSVLGNLEGHQNFNSSECIEKGINYIPHKMNQNSKETKTQNLILPENIKQCENHISSKSFNELQNYISPETIEELKPDSSKKLTDLSNYGFPNCKRPQKNQGLSSENNDIRNSEVSSKFDNEPNDQVCKKKTDNLMFHKFSDSLDLEGNDKNTLETIGIDEIKENITGKQTTNSTHNEMTNSLQINKLNVIHKNHDFSNDKDLIVNDNLYESKEEKEEDILLFKKNECKTTKSNSLVNDNCNETLKSVSNELLINHTIGLESECGIKDNISEVYSPFPEETDINSKVNVENKSIDTLSSTNFENGENNNFKGSQNITKMESIPVTGATIDKSETNINSVCNQSSQLTSQADNYSKKNNNIEVRLYEKVSREWYENLEENKSITRASDKKSCVEVPKQITKPVNKVEEKLYEEGTSRELISKSESHPDALNNGPQQMVKEEGEESSQSGNLDEVLNEVANSLINFCYINSMQSYQKQMNTEELLNEEVKIKEEDVKEKVERNPSEKNDCDPLQEINCDSLNNFDCYSLENKTSKSVSEVVLKVKEEPEIQVAAKRSIKNIFSKRKLRGQVKNLENNWMFCNVKKIFKCNDCDFYTDFKIEIKEHGMMHIKEIVPNSSSNSSIDALNVVYSREKIKPSKIKNQKQKQQKIGVDLFKCSKCDYSTCSNKTLKRHETTHLENNSTFTKGNYPCSKCCYMGRTQALLKRHEMTHLEKKKFQCSKCSYSTNFNSYLKEHKMTHSNMRPFKCSHCDFASKLKSNIKKHERTHSDQWKRSYKRPIRSCSICNFSTIFTLSLKKHLMSHFKNGVINVCQDCGYETQNSLEWETHVSSHFNEKLNKNTSNKTELVLKPSQETHNLEEKQVKIKKRKKEKRLLKSNLKKSSLRSNHNIVSDVVDNSLTTIDNKYNLKDSNIKLENNACSSNSSENDRNSHIFNSQSENNTDQPKLKKIKEKTEENSKMKNAESYLAQLTSKEHKNCMEIKPDPEISNKPLFKHEVDVYDIDNEIISIKYEPLDLIQSGNCEKKVSKSKIESEKYLLKIKNEPSVITRDETKILKLALNKDSTIKLISGCDQLDNTKSKIHKCPFCSYTTPFKRILTRHKLRHKAKRFYCSKCTFSIRTKHLMQLHKKKCHSNVSHNFEKEVIENRNLEQKLEVSENKEENTLRFSNSKSIKERLLDESKDTEVTKLPLYNSEVIVKFKSNSDKISEDSKRSKRTMRLPNNHNQLRNLDKDEVDQVPCLQLKKYKCLECNYSTNLKCAMDKHKSVHSGKKSICNFCKNYNSSEFQGSKKDCKCAQCNKIISLETNQDCHGNSSVKVVKDSVSKQQKRMVDNLVQIKNKTNESNLNSKIYTVNDGHSSYINPKPKLKNITRNDLLLINEKKRIPLRQLRRSQNNISNITKDQKSCLKIETNNDLKTKSKNNCVPKIYSKCHRNTKLKANSQQNILTCSKNPSFGVTKRNKISIHGNLRQRNLVSELDNVIISSEDNLKLRQLNVKDKGCKYPQNNSLNHGHVIEDFINLENKNLNMNPTSKSPIKRRAHRSRGVSYSCLNCSFISNSKDDLKNHMSSHLNTKMASTNNFGCTSDSKQIPVTQGKISETFSCHKCNKKCRKKKHLELHKLHQHGIPLYDDKSNLNLSDNKLGEQTIEQFEKKDFSNQEPSLKDTQVIVSDSSQEVNLGNDQDLSTILSPNVSNSLKNEKNNPLSNFQLHSVKDVSKIELTHLKEQLKIKSNANESCLNVLTALQKDSPMLKPLSSISQNSLDNGTPDRETLGKFESELNGYQLPSIEINVHEKASSYQSLECQQILEGKDYIESEKKLQDTKYDYVTNLKGNALTHLKYFKNNNSPNSSRLNPKFHKHHSEEVDSGSEDSSKYIFNKHKGVKDVRVNLCPIDKVSLSATVKKEIVKQSVCKSTDAVIKPPSRKKKHYHE